MNPERKHFFEDFAMAFVILAAVVAVGVIVLGAIQLGFWMAAHMNPWLYGVIAVLAIMSILSAGYAFIQSDLRNGKQDWPL